VTQSLTSGNPYKECDLADCELGRSGRPSTAAGWLLGGLCRSTFAVHARQIVCTNSVLLGVKSIRQLVDVIAYLVRHCCQFAEREVGVVTERMTATSRLLNAVQIGTPRSLGGGR
jgi:hypothetical protein